MASLAADALLLAAGVVAGMLGTAGAITSMVSYPALLAVGLSPLTANVGNLVALVTCWPGSALTSRQDLVGAGPWLRRSLPFAAAGTATGAVLLLTTPAAVFDDIVPALVAAGSLTLLAQPWLTARRGRRDRSPALALGVVAVVSIYGGYFGAGGGVMLLAAMLVLVDERMASANAIKNMLVGAGAIAAALVLVCARPAPWGEVVPLAIGLFVGSLLGPILARRLPAAVVRWAVAILGMALAIDLWVT